MKFNNKLYDVLKAIAQIYLPALGTLYAALAVLWHFPAVEQVGGTVLAVDTFLGVILGISSFQYNGSDAKYDGTVAASINPDTGKKTYTLQLNDDVASIDDKSELVFKMQTVS